MIDTILILVFFAGINYGIIGTAVSRKVRDEIDDAVETPLRGVYASFMITLLWPILVFLIVLTTAYSTLSGVSE